MPARSLFLLCAYCLVLPLHLLDLSHAQTTFHFNICTPKEKSLAQSQYCICSCSVLLFQTNPCTFWWLFCGLLSYLNNMTLITQDGLPCQIHLYSSCAPMQYNTRKSGVFSALPRKSNNNYHSTRLGSLLFPEKCMFADYKPLQEKQHLHTLQVPGILVCFVVPLNIHE